MSDNSPMISERIKALAECAQIARHIMAEAIKDRDIKANDDSDRAAAACWVDCASQILYEIIKLGAKE